MYARVGLRGMMITHAQKEGIAHQAIAKYQTKRLESYRKMHLSQLLGKDVLLFAALTGLTEANIRLAGVPAGGLGVKTRTTPHANHNGLCGGRASEATAQMTYK